MYLRHALIHLGRTQDLKIQRRTPQGFVLSDSEGNTAFLPASERLNDRASDGSVRVFIYRDGQGALTATTHTPKAEVEGLATMKVISVDRDGALLDWGLPEPLPLPHHQQRKPVVEGRWYVVRVAMDAQGKNIFGSTRHDEFLDNTELTVDDGDRVELMVLDRSDLGFSVAVNSRHQGLIHQSDVFRPISIGDRLSGYVREVRAGNKLDIILQAPGYRQYNTPNVDLLAKRLKVVRFLPLTDKSSAEDIHREFGISKKAFKQAVGTLYKERKIRLEEQGIVWVGE